MAFGFAGFAEGAAVVDELVGELDPVAVGDDFHEFLLDLGGGVGFGEAEAAGEAVDVGIDDNAFGEAKTDAKDDRGGFAGCAGDGDEFVECLGDLAGEFFSDDAACTLDGFGLVVEEAGGADERFQRF